MADEIVRQAAEAVVKGVVILGPPEESSAIAEAVLAPFFAAARKEAREGFVSKEDCEAMIALAVAAVRDRTLAEAAGKIRTMVGDREEEARRKGRGFSDFARVLADAVAAVQSLRSKPKEPA